MNGSLFPSDSEVRITGNQCTEKMSFPFSGGETSVHFLPAINILKKIMFEFADTK